MNESKEVKMNKRLKGIFFFIVFLTLDWPFVFSAEYKIRPLRERADIRSDLNTKRVDTLLLPAMRKAGIDCWVIMSREFKEDFVLDYVMDVKGATGGHRNAFIFFDDGSNRLKRIAIGTHLPGESKVWDKLVSYHTGEGDMGPSLKPVLRKTIEEFNPKKIGVNESRTIPFCDGLTVEMKKFLMDAIGPEYAKRLVSAEGLIVDFLDTRLPEELQYLKEAAEISRLLQEEVESNKAIIPGKTTLSDLRWYAYNRMAELDIETWYPPLLGVKRKGVAERLNKDSVVIQPGDIISNDMAVLYLGFYMDIKGTGYVLKPGETEPPKGLQKAFQNALRVQDAIIEVSRPGKIGFEVKEEAEKLCKKRGIDGSVFCHSTGLGGHGIGAWINPNWPDRYGVRATFPLRLGAIYSIESSATTEVPEWDGEKFSFGTEEDAYLTEQGLKHLFPRQEKIYVIK